MRCPGKKRTDTLVKVENSHKFCKFDALNFLSLAVVVEEGGRGPVVYSETHNYVKKALRCSENTSFKVQLLKSFFAPQLS